MTPNTTAVGPWTDAEDCSECGAADEKVRGVTDGSDVRHLCWECYIAYTGEASADGGDDDTAAGSDDDELEEFEEMVGDDGEDDTAAVSWRDVA